MRLLILRTVLVATDLDPASRHALDTAYRLAAIAGATLHVAHVPLPSAPAARVAAWHDAMTDEIRALMRSVNVPEDCKHVHVIPGETAETLGALADRLNADVIVLGRHRERAGGKTAMPIGSTARSVVERVHVPCLIAGQPLHLPLRRVLVPTDFSDPARGALLVGLSWASGLRAGAGGATSLTALHVWPNHEAVSEHEKSASLDRELELVQHTAGSWADIAVSGQPEHDDDAALAIERYAVAHASDLVVMGTRGLRASGESGLGSVSEAVATRARVPTLLVPPAVWRTYLAGH